MALKTILNARCYRAAEQTSIVESAIILPIFQTRMQAWRDLILEEEGVPVYYNVGDQERERTLPVTGSRTHSLHLKEKVKSS